MESTSENFRAMIYYDFRRGLSRQECIDQLIFTFDNKAPSYATVKRWYNGFNTRFARPVKKTGGIFQ